VLLLVSQEVMVDSMYLYLQSKCKEILEKVGFIALPKLFCLIQQPSSESLTFASI
jgi:hypothetical protein